MAKQIIWPADQVQRRAISELVPYARNSRTHSERQIDQIAASINEWGWTIPVLIDNKSGIIAGHARILAAQKLGIDDVPCMVAAGWTKAQIKAYVIADNKLAENAGWDEGILGLEFEDLKELDFDIELTGFEDWEICAHDFEPGHLSEQGRLDELVPKIVVCPHCSKEFDLRSNE